MATSASPSDVASAPNDATAEAAPDSPAACGLLTPAQVEAALHLHVDTVKVTSKTCDFTFKDALTQLTIEYDAQGGPGQLLELRSANAAVQTAVSGIVKTTAAGGTSASNLAQSAMADTNVPDVPKAGSDQYAFIAGPAKFLGVVNGDAYVEITGVFLPESLPGWQVEADLARMTFAAKS